MGNILKLLQKLSEKWPDLQKGYLFWLMGVFLALFVAVFSYFGSTRGKIIPGLSVAGIKVGGLKIGEAEKVLEKELTPQLEKKILLNYKKRTLSVILRAIGIKLDLPATVKQAYLVGRTGSTWSTILTRVRVMRRGSDLKPLFDHNQETLDSFYRLLDAVIAVEPVRSIITIDKTNNKNGEVKFSSSRKGSVIEHSILTSLFEKAVYNKDVTQLDIPVRTVNPPLTESEILNWGLNQVLGIYTTKFDPKQTDRVHNLEIACGAIDNVIVYPGQSFSFNTWVGPRVSETGYKEAPVVLYGKLVPGIGGGICQVSTTLYNAVLLSNLQITQTFNHTLPSTYVPLGRDATVVYGGLDFIFENTYQNPILLAARVQAPFVTVAVVGRKEGWESVALETAILETYPFVKKEIPDPELPQGTKLKESDGFKGFKVELWRTVTLTDGQIEKKLISTCIYPPQPEEYKVGTKRN